ncbi:MAG: hypothetical protein M1825_001556 [Sarcosagium campestre]|nr:MAG: hypothetical protein M1825_001556 [Sarcosagium campestre]
MHHKLGWALTWLASAQILIEVVNMLALRPPKDDNYLASEEERAGFISVSAESLAEHHRMHTDCARELRYTDDSGNCTQRNSASSPSLNCLPADENEDGDQYENRRLSEYPYVKDEGEREGDISGRQTRVSADEATQSFFQRTSLFDFLSIRSTSKALFSIFCVSQILNRLLLPFGFIALTTGMVTYGGVFVRVDTQRPKYPSEGVSLD